MAERKKLYNCLFKHYKREEYYKIAFQIQTINQLKPATTLDRQMERLLVDAFDQSVTGRYAKLLHCLLVCPIMFYTIVKR